LKLIQALNISKQSALHSVSMKKVLGILTEDFRLYHDLVATLKARDIPFVSLSFSQRIPSNVGAILTSVAESPRIRFPHKAECGDIEDSVMRALQLLRGKTGWKEVIIGIDPGSEPGLAVIGDGEVLDARSVNSPEAVAPAVVSAISNFPADRYNIRIGHGDATNRNRIINTLAENDLRVDIVDEKGTTRRTEHPDADAAIRIAFTPGVSAARHYDIRPTEGELKEIQRRSRLKSEGEMTISKSLARSVARGEMTLAEAISVHRRRKER